MNRTLHRLQDALGRTPTGWLFGGLVLYFLSITLCIPTPWLPGAPGYSFAMSLAMGLLPIAIGLLRNTPASITSGFLIASVGPYNQTTVILSFALGVYLGVSTLYRFRGRMKELFRTEFVHRGFYYLLALVAYIVMVWLLRLGDSTDGWSFLALASSLLTVPFAAYSLAYLPWDTAQVRQAMRNFLVIALALVAVALLYPALTGQFEQYPQAAFVVFKSLRVIVDMPFDLPWVDPDYNRVTFSSSHYFAAWMLVFAFAAFVMMRLKSRPGRFVLVLILALYAFAMGENAHIVPGAIAGAVAMGIVAVAKRWRPATQSAVALGITVATLAAVIGVLYFNGGRYSLSEKAVMYRAAAERIADEPARMMLGDGPATFGSRAANKRLNLPGIEIEYSFPFGIPDHASTAFKETIQKAKLEEGGSTMKRTLSGVVGLVMEWGILGTIFIAFLLWKILRVVIRAWQSAESVEGRTVAAAAVFGLAMLTVSLSVRTYFEYAELSALVAALVVLSSVSIPRTTEITESNTEHNTL